MRYPTHHKTEVRERIVRAASKALRERGLDGIGLPALMNQVGLTHGGFYAYFKNRDELVAAAVLAAGAETEQHVFCDGVSDEKMLLKYLSEYHLDHPEQGCVIAALGTEGVRQSAVVRKSFSEVASGLLHLVQKKRFKEQSNDFSPNALCDETLCHTATMVGAVVLARLVEDRALAQRILSSAHNAFREPSSSNA